MAAKKRRKNKSTSRNSQSARSAQTSRTAKKPLAPEQKKHLLVALVILVCVFVLLSGLSLLSRRGSGDGTEKEEETASWLADIAVQDYGTITVELDASAAPRTVDNFVKLANEGFYDGLTFHRIMEGFMMQGGDPEGNGTGGSGENIVGEFADNGYDNPISHVRGVISMARAAGNYDSASSQFFIVQEDSTFLDNQYAAFGHVTEGMDIVDQICTDAEPIDGNGTILPEEQPVITSITIREG